MAAPDTDTVEIDQTAWIDAQLADWMRRLRHAEQTRDDPGAAVARARIDDLLDTRNGH